MNEKQIEYLSNFQRELRNRNYAFSTFKIYTYWIVKYFNFSLKNPNLYEKKSISVFLDTIKSSEQRRLAYQSIRNYYKLSLKTNCPYILENIKVKKRLPLVLSKEEILSILSSIKNDTHRLMISFLYGSGLRISELINIKVTDINLQNNTLQIKNSKGNKDRITIISEKLKDQIKKAMIRKSSESYLFTTNKNKKYCKRTIQQIFNTALIKSKINKKATCHTLRHSFATHLIQEGVDIRTIKKLLGHKSIKTTMIYLHLTDIFMTKIKSPL
jgi:site-specific recombinase XerD